MSTPTKSLFVLGAKPYGVIIVRTDPGRVIHLTHEKFQEYATNYNIPISAAYDQIESVLARILFDADAEVVLNEQNGIGIEALLYKNFKITNADFAAVVEINRDFDDGGAPRRRSFNPLGRVMEDLDPNAADLKEFIISEIDPNAYPEETDGN